jgi:hypothetical protein
MSDANRVGLSAIKETTWGTTPTTPTFETIRITSESLNANIENIKSQELRSDGQVADLIQVGAESGGGINFELSYGGDSNINDEIMAGALFGAWTGVGDGSDTITAGASGSNLEFNFNSSTHVITLGSSVDHNIVEGIWIEVTGANAANNGYHFVTDVTGQAITVNDSIGQTEEVESTATITGEYLLNGTTQSSFSIERSHADLDTPSYFLWTGMVPGSMNLNFTNKQIVTGSFEFMGKLPSPSTSSAANATTAAGTNDVMSASSSVGQIMEGSTLATYSSSYIQSLSLTVNKALRAKEGIGTLGPIGIGSGTFDVTGSMSLYFADISMYTKFVNATATGVSWKTEDNDGNCYIFTMPNIKFSADNINAAGIDQEVLEDMNFQAIRHATYDYTLAICRFDA